MLSASTSHLNKAYGALMLMIAAADRHADATMERYGAEEAQYDLGYATGLKAAAVVVESHKSKEDECATG